MKQLFKHSLLINPEVYLDKFGSTYLECSIDHSIVTHIGVGDAVIFDRQLFSVVSAQQGSTGFSEAGNLYFNPRWSIKAKLDDLQNPSPDWISDMVWLLIKPEVEKAIVGQDDSNKENIALSVAIEAMLQYKRSIEFREGVR